MPVLKKDFRETKKIELPNYPESEVVIYDSVLVKDIDPFAELQQDPTKVSKILEALPKAIKSWNFTDEAGVDLPINSETLNMLNVDDVFHIVREIQDFQEEIKKNKGNMPSSQSSSGGLKSN